MAVRHRIVIDCFISFEFAFPPISGHQREHGYAYHHRQRTEVGLCDVIDCCEVHRLVYSHLGGLYLGKIFEMKYAKARAAAINMVPGQTIPKNARVMTLSQFCWYFSS